MSTLGIIGSLVVLAGGLIWLFYPMFVRPERLGLLAQTQKGRDELLMRYERVIATIRDLDDDNATGKINPEEYKMERAMWSKRGVEILKALEEAGVIINEAPQIKTARASATAQANGKEPKPMDANADDELDNAIEDAIAKYVNAMSE